MIVTLVAISATALVSRDFGILYIVYSSWVLGLVFGALGFVLKQRNRRLCVIAISLNLMLLIFGYPTRERLSVLEVRQAVSVHRIESLSQGVLKYRRENGGASPHHLVELLSQGYAVDYFYVAKPESQRVKGWQTDTGLLEDNADYVLPLSGSKILIFERPGIWPDGSVAVGFSDGNVRRLSVSGFEKMGVKWNSPRVKNKMQSP